MKTTKQCNYCNKIKPINNFTIKRSNKDGYFNICKSCKKDNDIQYARSINGVMTKCYNAHRSRAKSEDYQIAYTKQQLIDWFADQEHLIEIYERWVDHDYNRDYYPSVSKIDKHKRYSINNIQLLGWKDKLDKDHIKAREKADITNKAKIEENRIISKQKRDDKVQAIRDRTHKICSTCLENKEIECYSNSIDTIDGKLRECKQCNNLAYQTFIRTKKGTSYRIYKKQIQRSKDKGFSPPSYNLDELREWLFSQNIFHRTYDEWTNSGYETMMCVSCDRIDRFKGYSLDNMTVGTWQQNFDRYMDHRL